MLGDGPLAYWPLNDPGTYTDATGHGYTLSVGSGITTVSGPISGETAPHFSGGAAGLTRSSTFSFSSGATDPFSLELWVQASTTGTFFFTWGDYTFFGSGAIAFSRASATSITEAGAPPFAPSQTVTLPTVLTGTWSSLVWVFDGTSWITYQNGSLVSTATLGSPLSGVPTSTATSIGPSFTGAIGQVAFYPTALSAARVAAHYAAAFAVARTPRNRAFIVA